METQIKQEEMTLWDAEKTAEYLRYSVHQVYKLAREGKIPSHKRGGRRYFSPRELYDWIMNEQ